MAETTLITIADVQVYRRISPTFDINRFESFANSVQRLNLRGLLGDSLYFAFMDDTRTAGAYADLLNGKSYLLSSETIQFYGIKPVLCFWWLAVATREGDLFHSNVGAIQFTNNTQQNFESAKEKERIATGYMESAQGYANDCIKFLNSETVLYPLWKSTSATNKTNFLTFRI